MKISETLDKAADHIVAHGWYQGYYWPTGETLWEPPYTEGDPCCALGAIAVVEGVDPANDVTDAMEFLAQHLGETATGVADWNDAGSRTKDEVLAALRGAAERAKVLGR
jgi:hypothetical protein